MKKKNKVFTWMFRIYFAILIYELAYIRIYREYVLGLSDLRRRPISNIVVIVSTLIVFFIYLYLMKKWKIKYICPRCGQVLLPKNIRFSVKDGIRCKQKCKNCKNEWYPDMLE